MRQENLGFAEALRLLAQRAGVALAPREDEGRGRLFAANEAAAAFYHGLLLSAAGSAAREYLAGRGVNEETMAAFRLGFSPQSWNALLTRLEGEGFSRAEILAAGLLVESERGVYDRFRGRLIFPIADEEGRVTGFGARALDGGEPKYLNTPQTPAFDKGRTLYGLGQAKEAIRREGLAVIVEGYMDVIAAHQHGFKNVVASMGTSITESQVGILQRYARRLALALDADQAGNEATLRGIQVAARAADKRVVPLPTGRGAIRYQEVSTLELKVMAIPQGQDPDDVVRGSPDLWRRLVEGAQPVMEHLFAVASAGADLARPQDRSRLLAALLPALAEMDDLVLRTHYLQRLARLAQVSERALEDELRAYGQRREVGARHAVPLPGPIASPQSSDGDPLEEFLLALLLRYPDLREKGLALDEGLLLRAENRQLLEAWRQNPGSELEEALPPEIFPQLERINSRALPPYKGAEAVRALEGCLTSLERRRLAMAKRAASYALAEEEEHVGPGRAAALAKAAWQSGEPPSQEEEAAQAAILYLQDIEAGQRLHGRAGHDRGSGPRPSDHDSPGPGTS